MIKMCDVCMANKILARGKIVSHEYVIEAVGEGPEWKPCKYRIYYQSNKAPEHWESTEDLAGLIHRIGVDIKLICWSPSTLSEFQKEIEKFNNII